VGNIALILDAESGEELQRLEDDTDEFIVGYFSPDEKKFVTPAGNAVRIWDIESGKELQRLVGHTDEVYDVVFLPDGKKIATASYDGTVRIWTLE